MIKLKDIAILCCDTVLLIFEAILLYNSFYVVVSIIETDNLM